LAQLEEKAWNGCLNVDQWFHYSTLHAEMTDCNRTVIGKDRISAAERQGLPPTVGGRQDLLVGFPLFCLPIEIAIAIGIEIGARQGKIPRIGHPDTGSIWRPDPDFDFDRIAPSGAHSIMSQRLKDYAERSRRHNPC
jgi:hypothetical protein